MNLQRFITPIASPHLAIGVICALSVTACGGGGGSMVTGGGGQMQQQTTTALNDTALVASNSGVVATATTIDANLSNPWGLVTAPGLPFWVADNNSNVATLYSGKGAIQTAEVTGSNDVGISPRNHGRRAAPLAARCSSPPDGLGEDGPLFGLFQQSIAAGRRQYHECIERLRGHALDQRQASTQVGSRLRQ